MDPVAFNRIKEEFDRQHFKGEKLGVLRSHISNSYYYISVDQVAELVQGFSFDDEKLEAVQICAPKMSQATCSQLVPLLSSFSFDKNKVKVVESVVHIVVDPANHQDLDRAIDFLSDQRKAREVLQARQSMGPPPPHHQPPHHQHHHPPHHHHNPYYPPPPHQHPYPGNYPAGQVPPPGNPSYPPYPGAPPPPMGPPYGPGYPYH